VTRPETTVRAVIRPDVSPISTVSEATLIQSPRVLTQPSHSTSISAVAERSRISARRLRACRWIKSGSVTPGISQSRISVAGSSEASAARIAASPWPSA
jgi:hypothetical protein